MLELLRLVWFWVLVWPQPHDPTRSLSQPVEHVVVEKLGHCADDFARMSCCCLLRCSRVHGGVCSVIRHLVECSVVVRPALDSNDIGDSPRLVIQLQQVLLLRRSVSPLLGDDDGAVSNNVERLQTSFLSVPQSVDQPPVFGSVICRARVSIRHACNPLDFRGMTVRLHPHSSVLKLRYITLRPGMNS